MATKQRVKARLIGLNIASVMAITGVVLMASAISSRLTPGQKVYSLNSIGIKDGPCVAYHSGNKIKSVEGQYADGERDGVFTHWNEGGKVNFQRRYEKGRMEAVDERRTSPWWNGARDQ